MQHKRILLITENLGSGGAERQLCLLASLLKEKKYDVKVLTYGKALFYLPDLQVNDVEHIYLKQAENKWLRMFYFVRAFYKYKPTTIISFLPSANIVCCLARLFYKSMLIVSERSHTKKSVRSLCLLRLYNLADYVVTNSYAEAENLAKLYSRLTHKLRTIVNAVDPVQFSPASMPKNNLIRRIICVGRIIPSKNVINFIEAITIVKQECFDFKVDWYGKICSEEYVQQVYDKVKETGCGDIFCIHEPSRSIQDEYRKSDIFCIPSYLEGYPNVIVEAMSCGLPIICGNICENPRIVTENVNGFLFDPYNVESMVEVLKKILLLNNSELHDMGQKNRAKVLKENTEVNFVEKYINLI